MGPGKKGLDDFCTPHPDRDNCMADMNQSCGAFHHMNDPCYDCFNDHRQSDPKLKGDCDGPGMDGVHSFCDPEHDNRKCFAEMNMTCHSFFE